MNCRDNQVSTLISFEAFDLRQRSNDDFLGSSQRFFNW
jgi:hypothetical protein